MNKRLLWSQAIIVLFTSLLISSFVVVGGCQAFAAQASSSTWSKAYGVTGPILLWSAVQTVNGEYSLVGSYGAYAFLVKTDGLGNVQWNKTYIGEDSVKPDHIIQTADGGFAFSGMSAYKNGDHFWMLKTDSIGNAQFNKTYGAGIAEEARSIVQTDDGGYMLIGDTSSPSSQGWDTLLVKVDSIGNMLWNKTFGGIDDDRAFYITKTNDGNFVFCGMSDSNITGFLDFWLVKIDAGGNALWSKKYGGPDLDSANYVAPTADGGYVLAGSTRNYTNRPDDFWLVKTDSQGSMQWNKTYGGTGEESATCVLQTSDGGYALVGSTSSVGSGSSDFWLVKTDSYGNMQWSSTYGGRGQDDAAAVFQADDGGYVLAGYTDSYGVGEYMFWLLKTDAQGVTVSEPISVQITTTISVTEFDNQLGEALAGITITLTTVGALTVFRKTKTKK